MSSISANYSVRTLDPGQVDQANQANQTDKSSDKNLTISLSIAGASDINSPVSITLSYPLIGVEDIPLNELMQQLQGLDLTQFQGLTLAQTVAKIDQAIIGIAEALEGTTKEFFDANHEQIANIFGQIEKMADRAATELYDIVSNSSYPEFADFLKSMLETALMLRKSAADARTAAVQGEFKNTLAQADLMKEAAAERYKKAMEDVAAKRAEAWAQLAGAIVSIGVSFVGVGAKGFDGLQAVSGIATASSQTGSAIGGLIAAGHMASAAGHEKTAALLDARVKELEATNKLMQEAQNVSNELKEIAKQIMDMVLKLYQDFMSSQSQIIQRANI